MAGLAALAAGAACVAVTAAPAAGDDAELIRLADEIMTLHAETNRLSDIEDALPDWQARARFNKKKIRPLVDRHHEPMPELVMMRATTMAGFQAKARVLHVFSNCAPGYAEPDQDDALGWSLANDLLGVASVWRPDEDEEPVA
jgi:hypothetical protein